MTCCKTCKQMTLGFAPYSGNCYQIFLQLALQGEELQREQPLSSHLHN
uniref:Uncharacterized protein MANES_09G060400 n=1 Tax=Rhizophora mucronata TaxID=61149 RepID=A0A2P2K1G5_RHIMU